jgi:hypothetical protein
MDKIQDGGFQFANYQVGKGTLSPPETVSILIERGLRVCGDRVPFLT